MHRKNLGSIPSYIPGKGIEEVRKRYGLERIVKLASNENPYGASPKAIDAFRNFMHLHTYPEPDPEDLRQKIGEYLGFEANRIVLGAGIDGVLENIFKIFIDAGDEVVIPIPSFPYYHTLTNIYNAREVRVSRRKNFRIDSATILNAITEKTRVILICSPNNPTGNVEDEKEVVKIAESCDALVFVDEAYVEFSSRNMLELAEYENIIIARTFSKAFGLANLRIGYAVIPEDFRQEYLKVSTPFPLSTPAKLAAIAALDDLDYMKGVVEKISKERNRLIRKLTEMGIKVYPSEANFVLIESPLEASIFTEELMKHGVIVRDCSKFIGCNNYHVRVSIGLREENDMFLEAIKEIL
jgi:histidinol-phosphate aminotransferase